MRGAIYARRSVRNDNMSPENQVARCRAYALELARQLGQAVDVAADRIYVDRGASGKDFDRPEYIQLRRAVERREVDVLLVYAIDRLGRTEDVTDMLLERRRCMEYGVRVWAVTEGLEVTANDEVAIIRFFFGSLQAGKEREAIRRRCRQGKVATHRSKPGVLAFGGRPAYGYRAERGALVADEARREIVDQLFGLAAGGVTAEDIALALNRRRVAAPGGPVWYTRTVQRILANPIFAGAGVETTYTDPDSGAPVTVVIPAPALISPETFAAAGRQAAMRRRSRSAARGVFWLSGLLRCGVCGRYLVGCSHGHGKSAYRCIARAIPKKFDCTPCGMPIIPAALVEEPIWRDMRAVLADPSILAAALADGPDEAQVLDRLAGIGREIAERKRQQARLALDFARQTLTPEALASAAAALSAEIGQLETEATGLEWRKLATQRRGPAVADLDGLPAAARADLAGQMVQRVDVEQIGPQAVRATVFYYLSPEVTSSLKSYELSTGATLLVFPTAPLEIGC